MLKAVEKIFTAGVDTLGIIKHVQVPEASRLKVYQLL